MNKLTIGKLLKRNYKYAILIIVLTIVTSFLSAYPLTLIQDIVDTINEAYQGIIRNEDVSNLVTPLVSGVIIYLLFQIGQAVVNNITGYVINITQAKLSHQVRVDIYKHLDSLPQDFFDVNDSSELLNKLIQDSSIAVTGFISPVTYLSRAIFSFAFGFYFMCTINPKLTLIILPFALIASLITSLSGGQFRKYAHDARNKNGKMWREYQESIRGIRDIHASSQETNREKIVSNSSLDVVDNVTKTSRYSALVNVINSLSFIIIVSCMMLAGGLMIINGEDISIGGITGILMYNSLLSDPVKHVISMCIDLFKVNVSLERINLVLGQPIDNSYLYVDNNIEVNDNNSIVELNNLSFKYNEEKQLIDSLSLTINPKDKIGLVGETGSGKTTILKLIYGLYTNYEGKIKLFNNDVNETNKCALRKHISYVFQDTFLFNATIKENIIFANLNATEEELDKIIKISCVDEIINKLPNGINTLIGENGIKLSGGQKQRLAIARALLKDARVLVFDEATSALDNVTEKKMMDNIKENYPELTILMVAHRLSTIEDANQIYLLENGKIKENGTHEELLKINGTYRKLYEANIQE